MWFTPYWQNGSLAPSATLSPPPLPLAFSALSSGWMRLSVLSHPVAQSNAKYDLGARGAELS